MEAVVAAVVTVAENGIRYKVVEYYYGAIASMV